MPLAPALPLALSVSPVALLPRWRLACSAGAARRTVAQRIGARTPCAAWPAAANAPRRMRRIERLDGRRRSMSPGHAIAHVRAKRTRIARMACRQTVAAHDGRRRLATV
jgi:hypothetical protein